MKSAKSLLLALLVSGVMTIPGAAQSSANSPEGMQPQSQSGQNTQGTSQQSDQGQSSGKTMSDQQFLMHAAQVDLAEVQMAQLAQQKSSDNNVKMMAEHVMSDHQQNQQQLQQIAQKEGVTLPTAPDAKQQAEYDRLSKMSGAQFDKAFIRGQVKDHKKNVAIFQKVQSSAKDDAVKSYASQTLPKLEQHLQMAQQAAKQMGVNTSAGASETARNTQR